MAKSYIKEIADKKGKGLAATEGAHVKTIAPVYYRPADNSADSAVTTIQGALDGKASSTHTHGNIANGGTLTDTAAAAAGNDYVVIRDADNAKIQTSTIKGTDVADAVSKKHSHSTLTLSTTAQAYDGSHTLALPSTDPYTSARTPASHTHGNIQNGGTLQTSDITIASGDKLVVTDSSDSSKVARASVSFDGSTTTTALTPKGTFEAFAKAADITSAIQGLDVSSVGGAGKYISAISETDGKISATATTMDTTPTASSTNAVTSGGVKTAVDAKLDKTTYEWNKAIAFGSTGKLCVGKFPMYDSNVTITISTTTSIGFSGVIVIATQNINTSRGGTYSVNVFGDPTGDLSSRVKVKYSSGSRNFEVYIDFPPWSKNLIHIQANALQSAPTDIVTSVDTIPDTDILPVINKLTGNFLNSVGNTTLVSGSATKIGTQNGADVKLTLPTIPAAVSVKGNAESSYRTGQVNLTPANLGISATTSSVTVGSTTFNKYTHPTTSGNKHVPSGGSSGQFLGWSADGTAAWVANPNTDTKVTSSANHYTPATASGSDKTASASGATAAWSIDVVKGVTLNTDGKGHVTGLSVTSGKIPANPNTDTKVTSAANHYTPETASGSDKTASASGATAAWSIDVVKGVTLNTDGKGHVTGLSVTSGKIPANPNTDTKVTSAANHYTPATATGSDVTASATGATAAWSIDVVKGVTLNTDGKGHVTGMSVTSGKIPGNPNTDTKVTSSANHYTPATATGSEVTASATGATAAWSIDVVQGVTLNTDGKGHVTGMSVTSGKIPGNPNTDTKQRIVASTAKTYLTGVTTAPTSSNQDLTGVASTKVYATDGVLTATSFSGNLTGNVTGNCSGSSGSCTGNAATATTATNANKVLQKLDDNTATGDYYVLHSGTTSLTTPGSNSDVYGRTGVSIQPSTGRMSAVSYRINSMCTMQYNSSTMSVDFVF